MWTDLKYFVTSKKNEKKKLKFLLQGHQAELEKLLQRIY